MNRSSLLVVAALAGVGLIAGCSEDSATFGNPGTGAAPTGGGGQGAGSTGGGGAEGGAGASSTGGGGAGATSTGGGGQGAGPMGGGGSGAGPMGGGGSGAGQSGGEGGGGATGGQGGTGGEPCSPPAAPGNPSPTHQAANVDFATVTSLDWADSSGAASYDVYFGTSCPPPTYPDGAYQNAASSTLSGLSLSSSTDYCWKVVALASMADCFTEGPAWSFRTACDDPVVGPPVVTSGQATYAAGTVSGTYTLTFSEDVTDVDSSLTWVPVVGTGTMGAVTPIDAHTYSVDFSAVADGDVYELTVTTGVTDSCGNPLAAPVTVTIAIQRTGQSCEEAVDVTWSTFPVELTGTFDGDPLAGGSCDTTPTNAVWFTYTAPATGYYRVATNNETTTFAWSRLAIFDGTACDSYGPELSCAEAYDTFIESTLALEAGHSYLILFYTDDEPYTMVDPSIDITAVEGEGQSCPDPIDITSATFPTRVDGQFEYAAGPSFGCDPTVHNVVWLEYEAGATGWFDLSAFNSSPTATSARLTVFEGLGCSPPGTEIGCKLAGSANAQLTVYLVEGQRYLIAFGTNAPGQAMVDPIIDISPGSEPPHGLDCSHPATSASPNYYVGGGGEACWSWPLDAGDATNDNDFNPCDAVVGADVVVAYTTGAAQTTLSYLASVANTQNAEGYVAVEILEASCFGGTSLECYSPGAGGPTSYGSTIAVSPSTTYYVWVADGFADHFRPDMDVCLW